MDTGMSDDTIDEELIPTDMESDEVTSSTNTNGFVNICINLHYFVNLISSYTLLTLPSYQSNKSGNATLCQMALYPHYCHIVFSLVANIILFLPSPHHGEQNIRTEPKYMSFRHSCCPFPKFATTAKVKMFLSKLKNMG